MFRRFVLISTIALALAGTADAAQRRAGRRQARQDRVVERLQQRRNLNEAQVNGLRALQESRQRELQTLRQELRQKGQRSPELRQEMRERRRDINQRFRSGVRDLLK